MDRNLTPTKSSIALSSSEVAKRTAPGGRLPVKGAKNAPFGDRGWTPIGDATPAAIAGRAEREHARERPDLVQARAAKGK
jgi:hypothetical protein